MTTDTATAETTTATHGDAGPFRFRPSGRHRKPRLRRLVFTVGGFALAAGALSLVHLAPESATGGAGTAEAEPGINTPDTSATVVTEPATGAVRLSASVVTGAVARPPEVAPGTARTSAHPSSSVPRATDPATGIPEAPSTPTATTPDAPWPTPSGTATTQEPEPDPSPAPARTHGGPPEGHGRRPAQVPAHDPWRTD
ncbi:hypothetical protein [Streptomyces sp. CA-106131]|uniref:hypothetical protein n=1 Tax=Streptomyces sp. CA-106131 TaxID=3240045 RepID=UPI003D90B9C5